MKFRKNLIKILSGVLLIIFILWLLVIRCSEGSDEEDSDSIVKSAVPVRVLKIEPERIEWGVSIVGIIMPDKGVDILAEVGGKVKGIYFNVGDFVNKGKVLVKLDDEYKRYDLMRTEAQYKSSKVDFEKSELDLKRYEKLFETKSISQQEFESMKLKRDVSEANYLTAESVYKTAKRLLGDTEIKSPFGGFISQKRVEVGDMAAIGSPVSRVVDILQVKLNVEVAEKDMVKIKVNAPVKINVDVYANEEFFGKVTAVSPEADTDTKTFPVEIKLKNTDDFRLKPGMVAKGKIITEISENTILLAQEVIIRREGEHYVFLVKGDKAVERKIETGGTYSNRVEVKSGLSYNDTVIVSGSEFLSTDDRIQVQD